METNYIKRIIGAIVQYIRHPTMKVYQLESSYKFIKYEVYHL